MQRASKKSAKAERVSSETRKKKLTKEEQEELEEKELEEACERWCARIIRIVTIGSMIWGMVTPIFEWATRPPVLLQRVELIDHTYVVTGATDGIGLEATRQLAKDGARLIIGARDPSKGSAVAALLRAQTNNDDIESRYLDLANLSSVVEFAASITAQTAASHAADGGVSPQMVTGLLNNAGGLEGACTPTVDGFETAMQVNYLAPALLTHLLLPHLQQSPIGARIVHVSCPVADKARLALEHLEPLMVGPSDGGDGTKVSDTTCDVYARYGSAKLMTLSFNTFLAKTLAAHKPDGLTTFPVTTNAFDPVSVDTAFAAKEPTPPSRRRMSLMPQMLIRRAFAYLLSPLWRRLGRLFMRSAQTAGYGLVHVATSPHLSRVSGKVYSLQGTAITREAGCTLPPDQCALAKPPANLASAETAKALWEATHVALQPWMNGSVAATGSGTAPQHGAADHEVSQSGWDSDFE